MAPSGGGGEERFEAWLRERGGPRPRPELAAELRRRFVAGELGESRSRRAGGLRKPDVNPDLEGLAARSPIAPAPREAFREELRADFVAGRLGASATSAPPRPAGRLLRLAGGVAGLAAAAAAVVVVLRSPAEPATGWSLVVAEGSGPVRVEGRSVAGDEAFPAPRSLPAGQEVAVGDWDLSVRFGDELRMEVRPGTRFVLASATAPEVRLVEGEVFLQTLAGYRGAGLVVDTPETRIAVSGTTLGVLAEEAGTCVCVVEGRVAVTCRRTEGTAVVEERRSHYVFRGPGSPPETVAFGEDAGEADPHVADLVAFSRGD